MDGNFHRSFAFLHRLIKGCFPDAFLYNDLKAIREWVGPPCAVMQVKHCFSFKIAIYMYYMKSLMLTLIGGSHVGVKGKRSRGKSTSYARVLRLECSWYVQGTEWGWARVVYDSKEASRSQLLQGPVTTVGLWLLPWVIWETIWTCTKGNLYNPTTFSKGPPWLQCWEETSKGGRTGYGKMG